MKNFEEYKEMVNSAITDLLKIPDSPERLFAPIHYTLEGGGKRLRPVLFLAVADALGADLQPLLQVAAGIEFFHNFTLLHDDIMDRSETRHNRPTAYKKWGEANAILSGDAMLTCANLLLTCNPGLKDSVKVAINQTFNMMAMNVYRGQQHDMDFESRDDVSVDEYLMMIGYKTGDLISGACVMGAKCVEAPLGVCNAFLDYGYNLGLAFQLQDDLLDSFGDEATFGKPIGGDILNDKKTWLNITARAEAPERMAQVTTLTGSDKIAAVKQIYLDLDLPVRCGRHINDCIAKALESLADARLSQEAMKFFSDLALNLVGRSR